ncbi:D-sedoheptulose 7-phosphate isomerase [hydrothermal vent metagenome]|uniref:D-sedoheptulose 7-phosphate isomerase n=1 Tax=hydrothermal vent metagenome TaxID=652676 RepID=A0A3B0WUE2_9ZZZZ
MKIDFKHALLEHTKAIESVLVQSDKIEAVVQKIIESIAGGGKVIWLGNGGSAADAQHMAAELMVRYVKNRQPIASISLTTDTSILTAHSNDYSFDTVFSRQIEGLASLQDVVIGLSTSGESVNVIKALEAANQKGCFTVAMTGGGQGELSLLKRGCSGAENSLSQLSDLCLQVHSNETARVQEAHSFISHLICEGLDSVFE